MKRAAWPSALTAVVGLLLLWLLIGPYVWDGPGAGTRVWLPSFVRDTQPPSDLPPLHGYRTVWHGPHGVTPGDRLIEVVDRGFPPFVRHFRDPLAAAAFIARRSRAAVLITLGIDSPRRGRGPHQYLGTANARIDEVIFDHDDGALTPGATIEVRAHRGTRVTFDGQTQIVERVDFVRAPRVNGRYLLFIGHRDFRFDRTSAFGDGNAFEIRGSRVVHMSLPDADSWRRTASLSQVLSTVRRRAALPALRPGEVERETDVLR